MLIDDCQSFSKRKINFHWCIWVSDHQILTNYMNYIHKVQTYMKKTLMIIQNIISSTSICLKGNTKHLVRFIKRTKFIKETLLE